MENVKRITPEEVVAAYKATGLKPIQRDMYQNGTCACAIGVILYPITKGLNMAAWSYAERQFNHPYLWGFMRGYDSGKKHYESDRVADDDSRSVYDLAYEDGQAAWNAVVEAGLVGDAVE